MVAAALVCNVPALWAVNETDLVRDVLRQQSSAERAGCSGVQRVLAAGSDVRVVVRTAVELGYNSCQMIRCALEAKVAPEGKPVCEQVLRGAAEAGVPADVISRCSSEACDPAVVAAVLGEVTLDPYYCYFSAQPLGAPELPPPQQPIIGRDMPAAQASPFRF